MGLIQQSFCPTRFCVFLQHVRFFTDSGGGKLDIYIYQFLFLRLLLDAHLELTKPAVSLNLSKLQLLIHNLL